jgi:hypothetical protein
MASGFGKIALLAWLWISCAPVSAPAVDEQTLARLRALADSARPSPMIAIGEGEVRRFRLTPVRETEYKGALLLLRKR